MYKKLIIALVITCSTFSISGCGIAYAQEYKNMQKKFNLVHAGMSRNQVVKALGVPQSSSAINKVEYMKYYVRNIYGIQATPMYYVALKNNRVISYGSTRDFRTPPEVTENLNITHRELR